LEFLPVGPLIPDLRGCAKNVHPSVVEILAMARIIHFELISEIKVIGNHFHDMARVSLTF
jgi:hypothetical protein